jgi:hypothetical protein
MMTDEYLALAERSLQRLVRDPLVARGIPVKPRAELPPE